eukprot:9466540-Pyramimonas_sp.AAC.1
MWPEGSDGTVSTWPGEFRGSAGEFKSPGGEFTQSAPGSWRTPRRSSTPSSPCAPPRPAGCRRRCRSSAPASAPRKPVSQSVSQPSVSQCEFLWAQASQVIQSYGSALSAYGLVFLGAHFIWGGDRTRGTKLSESFGAGRLLKIWSLRIWSWILFSFSINTQSCGPSTHTNNQLR